MYRNTLARRGQKVDQVAIVQLLLHTQSKATAGLETKVKTPKEYRLQTALKYRKMVNILYLFSKSENPRRVSVV
jgi:hypothetical protein